jgi:flavin-dependent dehydrogenase
VLVAPCDGELHCVCVMPPQEDFHRWRRDAPEMLERRLTHAGTLTARLRDARRVGRVRGSGTLSSYLRTGAGPGWALVGDAAAAVHPCIGAGIDHAVRCAGALADALDGVLSGQASWERAAAEYGRARDEIVTPTLELAVELAARRELASDQRALFGLVVTLPGLGYDVAARTADVVSLISGPERRRRLEALLGLGVNGTGQSAVPEPAIP